MYSRCRGRRGGVCWVEGGIQSLYKLLYRLGSLGRYNPVRNKVLTRNPFILVQGVHILKLELTITAISHKGVYMLASISIYIF